MWTAERTGGPGEVRVNGRGAFDPSYLAYHERRFARVLAKLREIGARRIIEVGAHPWAMTALLLDEPAFELVATVSAEEVTMWPDDIGVRTERYRIRTARGREATVTNLSANVERTLFEIPAGADTVVACEIVEHLVRSPHVMFLNANRWLPTAGRLLVTTPNGLQFSNPFRRRSPTPAYRSNIYERHSYVYALGDLTELISLCGFRIVEAGYWDPYRRQGPSRFYGVLSWIPLRYCQDKFKKTIYVVAEKASDVWELERCPRVYDPRGNWEFIARRP